MCIQRHKDMKWFHVFVLKGEKLSPIQLESVGGDSSGTCYVIFSNQMDVR